MINTTNQPGNQAGTQARIHIGNHIGNHIGTIAAGVALATLAALALAACGNGYARPNVAAVASPASSTAPAGVEVKAGTTGLGRVLVGPDGHTLYGFTNDVANQSTCSGTCATAWPPVIVTAGWQVAPGLDSGLFSTIVRADGQEQLMAGRWPLYYFAADAAPGDVNGQGSGDVWFVVGRDARLVRSIARPSGPKASAPAGASAAPAAASAPSGDGYGYGGAAGSPSTDPPLAAPGADAAPALDVAAPEAPTVVPAASVAVLPATRPAPSPSVADLALADSPLGRIVVDRVGSTLYALTNDVDGVSSCEGRCATTWPPAVPVGAMATVVDGIDRSHVAVTTRADGSAQLALGGWPLYTFSGDARPGDRNGQGSGGVWFVIGAGGQLIEG